MGPGAGIAAQDVLICGWGDSTFMVALLHSMDEELPKGSQVTVLNLRSKEEVFGERPAGLHLFLLTQALWSCQLPEVFGSGKARLHHVHPKSSSNLGL